MQQYLKEHDTNGLDIRILSPVEAIKATLIKDPSIDAVATIGAGDADSAATALKQANLTGKVAKQASQKLGRRLTPAERGQLMELADYMQMNSVRDRVDEVVKDPAVADKLKPWYRQFCKRPCFHDEYLQTFNRPNVHLIDTEGRGVDRLTEGGVVVDGVEYEVDCLIFATGFEVGTTYTRRAGYDIVGYDVSEERITEAKRRKLVTAGFVADLRKKIRP